MNPLELTGRAQSHLAGAIEPGCVLHEHVVTAFLQLRKAAQRAGIGLVAASSFRDFARQLRIWNEKYGGLRPLVDAGGRPLDVRGLSAEERVTAILGWSALPGASRHHWGTDVDLIDARAVPAGYSVQLTPEEFAPSGPFAAMAEWLRDNAGRFGFFQPYRGVLSGVLAEPWHFSFAPVAESARRSLTTGVLAEALGSAALEGKAAVLARIDELHARYVAAIDWP